MILVVADGMSARNAKDGIDDECGRKMTEDGHAAKSCEKR